MSSSIPEKMKIPVAIEKYSKMSFEPSHITTSNFMQFGVAYTTELVPKQKFKIKTSSFARMSPLVTPTMGRGRVNNRTFFVPFRTVWPAWNDYKEKVKHTFSDGTSGFVTTEPYFSDDSIRAAFRSNALSQVALSGDAYDVDDIASDGTITKRKLTARGRQALKILHSVGMTLDFDARHGSFHTSALPLLTVAKVYIDWYLNPQYSEDVRYTNLIKVFKYDKSDYQNVFDTSILLDIFEILSTVNYSPDYFVSAWDKPNNPNTDIGGSSIVIKDITSNQNANNRQVYTSNNAGSYGASETPVLAGTSTNGSTYPTGVGPLTSLTQFSLNALRKLTDFLKRNQMAGSRLIDRYLSRYGIVLESDKLNRSYRLRDEQSSLLFGDVTSTADTEGANLGSYAGKGVFWNDNEVPVSFTAEEYGRLIVVSTIVPATGYYQGQHRSTMSLTALDHWTPEFDQLDVQAINKRELYVPLKDGLDVGPDGWNGEVFGFTPRYSHYKVAHDVISGDFRCDSLNVGMDAWHLMRDLSPLVANRIFPKHSIIFTEGFDASQYNRIFQVTNDVADKFIVHHQFDISSVFPGASLWDTYEFESDGEKVDINAGGTQVN